MESEKGKGKRGFENQQPVQHPLPIDRIPANAAAVRGNCFGGGGVGWEKEAFALRSRLKNPVTPPNAVRHDPGERRDYPYGKLVVDNRSDSQSISQKNTKKTLRKSAVNLFRNLSVIGC